MTDRFFVDIDDNSVTVRDGRARLDPALGWVLSGVETLRYADVGSHAAVARARQVAEQLNRADAAGLLPD